jgi:hypothetical protein
MAGTTVVDSGTFTLTRLIAFQFYGYGEVEGTELPPDFCGGRVIFRFHATSSTGEETVGLYEVNCQIHDPGGKTPRGTSEGVKANARDQLQQARDRRQPLRNAAVTHATRSRHLARSGAAEIGSVVRS